MHEFLRAILDTFGDRDRPGPLDARIAVLASHKAEPAVQEEDGCLRHVWLRDIVSSILCQVLQQRVFRYFTLVGVNILLTEALHLE